MKAVSWDQGNGRHRKALCSGAPQGPAWYQSQNNLSNWNHRQGSFCLFVPTKFFYKQRFLLNGINYRLFWLSPLVSRASAVLIFAKNSLNLSKMKKHFPLSLRRWLKKILTQELHCPPYYQILISHGHRDGLPRSQIKEGLDGPASESVVTPWAVGSLRNISFREQPCSLSEETHPKIDGSGDVKTRWFLSIIIII